MKHGSGEREKIDGIKWGIRDMNFGVEMTVDTQEADRDKKEGRKKKERKGRETVESRRDEICVQSANPANVLGNDKGQFGSFGSSRSFLLPLFAR